MRSATTRWSERRATPARARSGGTSPSAKPAPSGSSRSIGGSRTSCRGRSRRSSPPSSRTARRSGDRVVAVEVPFTDLGLRQDLHARFWDPAKGYVLRLSKMLTGQSSWLKTQLAKEVLKEHPPERARRSAGGHVARERHLGTSGRAGITTPEAPADRRPRRRSRAARRGAVARGSAVRSVPRPLRRGESDPQACAAHRACASTRRGGSTSTPQSTLEHLAARLSQAQSAAAIADAPSGGIYRGDLRHARVVAHRRGRPRARRARRRASTRCPTRPPTSIATASRRSR